MGNIFSDCTESKVVSLEADLVVPSKNTLGECPLWCERRQRLMWVDIDGKMFWSLDPETKDVKSIELPERPGSFCLTKDDRLIFAFEKGPAFYDPEVGPGSLERIATFDESPGVTRMNDGRVDPQGRFVVGGYVEQGTEPVSAIYRLSPGASELELLIPRIACTNSICFRVSPEGGTRMVFCDSKWLPREIKVVNEYDKIPGSAVNEKAETLIKWQPGEEEGGKLPDGSIVDSEGNIWCAHFGRGKMVRYNKEGRIDCEVSVPVPHVTCAALGGKDYRTMFITNASRKKLSEEERKKLPDEDFAGGLFAVKLPEELCAGMPECRFG
uniref:SMP-30/Gluconolactonase/LRE-like region domain-containing protein n=1 Tax=Chromera velia CCMP2878 TaxID=1169474 RepID=A0A0G4IET9_9ALVE|mmetsp:Transcript_19593/g.39447  ORF Transcript_19593/g.39447 Transcript_19593/m.39447 type:complete len:326 (-) Transcript_19593:1247-2224(-)|eukprot:Cvel_13827.t1-p1 / transcript=Cvel_13827.t1 / gene=Cvel_13827 / organism=Chromera_velia_CCMP2878 / gene_product=L-arabinolactonase, putative / transcript_product=L-arabinolactonase, putative / location=Cvel_scaffold960:18338-19938(+) / protein_length=325 / sequence_SO=supercontig / SO=protein_coding / is_pseudo=false